MSKNIKKILSQILKEQNIQNKQPKARGGQPIEFKEQRARGGNPIESNEQRARGGQPIEFKEQRARGKKPKARGKKTNPPTPPPAPPTTPTTEPAQTNVWDSFPCVKNATGIQINGDVATLESGGSSFTFKRNGTYIKNNNPKDGGSWSCNADNNIELRPIEESTPDSKVSTTVTNQSTDNGNTNQSTGNNAFSKTIERITNYGRFDFFQESEDGMVVNRFIIDQAVSKIVNLINKQYRGLYFDQFRYSLLTIKEKYCDKFSGTIPALKEDGDYLLKKIDLIVSAKTQTEGKINVSTNLSLAKTGELNSFEDPDDKQYYNELKLSTISPWDKFGIGADNISVWIRSDVGTKSTEEAQDIMDIDKYMGERTGTTETCLASLKRIIKLVPGMCGDFDPNSELGICTEQELDTYSNSNNIDIRLIKQAVNVCNNNGNLNNDRLIKYFNKTLPDKIVQTPKDFGFPKGTTAEDRRVKRYVEKQAPLRATAYRKIIDDLRRRGIIYTETSFNGTPMTWRLQPMRNEQKNIDMKLKNTIRKTLVETKENKKRLIQESRIVENRFNFILESKEIKSRKDYNNFLINVLSEMVYLHKQGFNNKLIAENAENLFGALGNIFGGGANSVMATFKEKGINWILNKLGMSENSTMKNFMVTAIGNTDLKDVPKLFTDCDFLTKKIAESVPEALLRKLQHEQGMGGDFADVIRNSLHDVVKTSNFSDKIEEKIGEMVCPLVNQISGIFGNKLDSMKSSLISPQQ